MHFLRGVKILRFLVRRRVVLEVSNVEVDDEKTKNSETEKRDHFLWDLNSRIVFCLFRLFYDWLWRFHVHCRAHSFATHGSPHRTAIRAGFLCDVPKPCCMSSTNFEIMVSTAGVVLPILVTTGRIRRAISIFSFPVCGSFSSCGTRTPGSYFNRLY